MFLSEWREFPSVPCVAGKTTWWQLASRCCWNRAHPWHASGLVSFLVRLRTYQHLGTAPSHGSATYLFIKHDFHDQSFQILPFSIKYSAPKLKLYIGRILISTYWKSMTSFPFFACDFSVSCISSLLLVPNIFPFLSIWGKNQWKVVWKAYSCLTPNLVIMERVFLCSIAVIFFSRLFAKHS